MPSFRSWAQPCGTASLSHFCGTARRRRVCLLPAALSGHGGTGTPSGDLPAKACRNRYGRAAHRVQHRRHCGNAGRMPLPVLLRTCRPGSLRGQKQGTQLLRHPQRRLHPALSHLERFNFEKGETRRRQHSAARPKVSGKTAFFPRNDRPYGLKCTAFQTENALGSGLIMFYLEGEGTPLLCCRCP